MPHTQSPVERPVRDVADSYVASLAELDPLLATRLGINPGEDRLPDFGPEGRHAQDELARVTLTALDAVERQGAPLDEDERRCGRLLRERLEAGLAVSATQEHLRDVRNIFSPVHAVRVGFLMMPAKTDDDWATVARRMTRVPDTVAGYVRSLREGARLGLLAAPRQVHALVAQLDEWLAAADGHGWFADFAAPATVSGKLRGELDGAIAAGTVAVADLSRYLAGDYLRAAEGTSDGVGEERYLAFARQWNGANLDLPEVYAWGWAEFQRLRASVRGEAERVLPGAPPLEAMRHLDAHSEVVEGVPEIRERLQRLMDEAVSDLDGTHFDLTPQMRRVEACIAPAGSAAAPYYTRPSQDFSRPGRTWLPTLGQRRFPLWNLVSTWYHEGVPGHHLQHSQWVHLARRLSTYQTAVGSVSACSEGWALYAERLMDELGYLQAPGTRLGYLAAQLMRAIRVVIDVGMHLRYEIPGDSPVGAGERWTAELGLEFFAAHSGHDRSFVESEVVRYLGCPGQAISYKLGERAWLAGREEARKARGSSFDLKRWHMSALSLGILGLDDLSPELARL